MNSENQQQSNGLNNQISETTNQSTNSRNQSKYEYHDSKKIYYSNELRNKKGSNRVLFNFYGQFVDRKQNLLILEDFALDCIYHVRINSEIAQFFEKYFYPWYVFRLHRVECTAAQTNYLQGVRENINSPKTIYCNLNSNECINWIVVFSLLSNQNQLIKVHKSKSPTIEEQDKNKINEFRDRWSEKMTKTSICEFRHLKDKKDCFVAQIIEIKQISPYKIILKVWDGTIPEFELRLPIDTSLLNVDYEVHSSKDVQLDQLTAGKQCYVYLVGERHIEKFQSKKPGDYVLFVNCKFYSYTKMQPPVFRIELNEIGITDKAYVQIFDKDTQIGKILTNKLKSHLDNIPDSDDETPTNVKLLSTSPQNTFDHSNIQNNQIHSINNFNDIQKFNLNYQIFCKIIDIFPLQYSIYDLIILKCSNCQLQDSVKSLFNYDLDGLRKSVFLFRISNKLNSKVNCPGCLKPFAYFKFSIIFLLEDKESERCVTIMKDDEVKKLFKTTAIDVLADEDKEFVFLNQLKELIEIFNNLNTNHTKRSIVIYRDNEDIYNIKAVLYQRDLIRSID